MRPVAPERVVLAPPSSWTDERLLDAARALPDALPAVEVGDVVGELLVVRVEPSPAPSIEVVPRNPPPPGARVDLSVLVDCGASMAERWSAEHTRAQAARAALEAFLAAKPARVASIHVHPFGASLAEAAPPSDLPAPKGKARAATALQALLGRLAAEPTLRAHAVMLLTDGPSEPDRLVAAAQRAGRLGIPVHVVVFAPKEDEVLAQVARASGGTIQRAALPLSIEFPEESS